LLTLFPLLSFILVEEASIIKNTRLITKVTMKQLSYLDINIPTNEIIKESTTDIQHIHKNTTPAITPLIDSGFKEATEPTIVDIAIINEIIAIIINAIALLHKFG
jgi:hypothetical protein